MNMHVPLLGTIALLAMTTMSGCAGVRPPSCMTGTEMGTVKAIVRTVPQAYGRTKAENPHFITDRDTVTVKLAMDGGGLRTCAGQVNGSVEMLEIGDHVHIEGIRRTRL